MAGKALEHLSRRERQIMDIVYRRGRATAAEVHQDLPDPPTYTAVRGTLRLLVDKGMLRHKSDGPRYVYLPVMDPARLKTSAIKHLVQTFFNNSAGSAVAAMVGVLGDDLSDDELAALERAIKRARKKGGAR